MALLIHEAPGAGGIDVAKAYAKILLCASANRGCGQCRSCIWVEQGEHPDLQLIVPDPEKKLQIISVDQIRELSASLMLTSHAGDNSCAIIHPAEQMNRAASNALLKTLEEPRRGAHLVLVTTDPQALPATVRSRCQRLPIAAPTRADLLRWLQSQRPAATADWEAAIDVLGPAPTTLLQNDPVKLRRLRDETQLLLQQLRDKGGDIVRIADQWAKDELPLRLQAVEHCLRLAALEQSPAASLQLPPQQALRLLDQLHILQHQLNSSIAKPLAVEAHLWQHSSLLPH